MGERVRISNGEVWLDDDNGLVRVALDPGVMVTGPTAREQIAAVAKVSKGKRLPLLVDLRSRSSDMEAREYFAGPESRATWRAVAMLGNTPMGEAQGKMWAAAHDHPDAPARFYFAEADAIEWLKTFVDR